jgi:hypothetical protein
MPQQLIEKRQRAVLLKAFIDRESECPIALATQQPHRQRDRTLAIAKDVGSPEFMV